MYFCTTRYILKGVAIIRAYINVLYLGEGKIGVYLNRIEQIDCLSTTQLCSVYSIVFEINRYHNEFADWKNCKNVFIMYRWMTTTV